MDYKFIIPTIISIAAIIWSYFQRRKVIQLEKSLDKKNVVHKFQFEKEFNIYQELWAKLVELRNITASLRPVFERVEAGKSNHELKIEKLKKIYEAFNQAVIVFDKNKPFYSTTVYNEIDQIFRIAREEMIEFEHFGYTDKSDYKKAAENVQKIVSSMDKICNIIRQRIDFVEIIN